MDAAQDGELAVKAERASFAWEHEMPPVLHISLEAIKGQLVMVVGAVGSGKSSLIAALLGELHARHGSVQVFSMCRAHKSPLPLSFLHHDCCLSRPFRKLAVWLYAQCCMLCVLYTCDCMIQ